MYITPKTDIRLLRGCPCDPEHVHTLYFNSVSAQASYFMELTKYNLNNYTYQRYAKNILRVQILADNIYDVNYMMFRNSAYGDKWFYAFVDRVEYLNDVTTEIEYHIDDIQTWLFDMQLNQCFIERMHSVTDNVGDNIVPEPVEVGEYVYNDYAEIEKFSQLWGKNDLIMVARTEVDNDSYLSASGTLYDGVYGACELYACSATADGITAVNSIINEYKQAPDSIVSIYMCPGDVLDDDTYEDYVDSLTPLPSMSVGQSETVELGYHGDTIDNYTPKNNKLFTYPYNFQNIINGEGANLALRYEFFETQAKVFISGTVSQPVQIECKPCEYKGVSTDAHSLPIAMADEKIVLANYPMCSWNIDAWKVWWAQNAVPMVIKGVQVIGNVGIDTAFAAIGAKEGGEEGGKDISISSSSAKYAWNTIASSLTKAYKASIQADYTKGDISSANTQFAHASYSFKHGRMSVNHWQAKIIDEFFSRFGYAINEIDTPRIHTRQEWTYIKTADCTCHGSIPSDSERNIETIFNNGITFWVNPAHVGDYRYNNPPII